MPPIRISYAIYGTVVVRRTSSRACAAVCAIFSMTAMTSFYPGPGMGSGSRRNGTWFGTRSDPWLSCKRPVEKAAAGCNPALTSADSLSLKASLSGTNRDVTTILIGARTTAHIDNAFDGLDLDAPASWMDEMNSWQNLRASLPGLKQILRNSLRLGVSAV